MALTAQLDHQCSALIQEARKLLAQALRMDPTVESLDAAQLITRLEALRSHTGRVRAMTTGVRTNAVNLRLRSSRRKASLPTRPAGPSTFIFDRALHLDPDNH